MNNEQYNQINHQLNNLFIQNTEELTNLVNLGKELISIIKDKQIETIDINSNFEEKFTNINTTFETIDLLINSDRLFDANILLENVWDRLRPLVNFMQLFNIEESSNIQQRMLLSLTSNNDQSKTYLFLKFTSLFNIFVECVKDSYRGIEEIRPDIFENNITINNNQDIEINTTPSSDIKESINNYIQVVKDIIDSFVEDNISFNQFKHNIENTKKSLSIFTNNFLNSILEERIKINITNINELFTYNIQIQQLYIFMKRVLTDSLINVDDNLESLWDDISSKIETEYVYPFNNGDGFVKTLKLTNSILK